MLVVALGSGEPALTVANLMRFFHLQTTAKTEADEIFIMSGNWRGARAAARGRLTEEAEGGRMLCH